MLPNQVQSDARRVLCPVAECEAGYNLKAAFPDFPQVLKPVSYTHLTLPTKA